MVNFCIDDRTQLADTEPMSRHSTIKIGGAARFFAQPTTHYELMAAVRFARESGIGWIPVGNSSNVLYSDDVLEGVVIALNRLDAQAFERDGDKVRVSAGMGLGTLASILAKEGLSGLEFINTIPGTVGGALVMNAGFSREKGKLNQIGEHVEEVRYLDEVGQVRVLEQSEIEFSYRSSTLANKLILGATFKLAERGQAEIWDELRKNQQYRCEVQDVRFPNTGSIFKNPGGSLTAGQLLDRAGLKGYRIGDAQFSERHANYIVNRGQARARDVLELIDLAKERIKREYYLQLETEIKTISNQDLIR